MATQSRTSISWPAVSQLSSHHSSTANNIRYLQVSSQNVAITGLEARCRCRCRCRCPAQCVASPVLWVMTRDYTRWRPPPSSSPSPPSPPSSPPSPPSRTEAWDLTQAGRKLRLACRRVGVPHCEPGRYGGGGKLAAVRHVSCWVQGTQHVARTRAPVTGWCSLDPASQS